MFSIRRATLEDVPTLSHQRCQMWYDMGRIANEAVLQDMIQQCHPAFAQKLNEGNYVAFLVYLTDSPETIVAGGGAEIRTTLPFPDEKGHIFPTKAQAHIVNIFTESDFRRKGLGKLVMQTILNWCETEGIQSITLAASDEGRPLYEGMGFLPVNNIMRLNRA